MNNYKPILFSTKMVEAILEGRKTQTRRVKDKKAKIRDVFWVRETHRLTDFLHPTDDNYGYIYRASQNGKEWEKNMEEWKWKPSIFMPKAACRLFLEVTNVRVELLQDISDEDAKAEGVDFLFPKDSKYHDPNSFLNYTWHGAGGNDSYSSYSGVNTAMESFQSLWYKINGKQSWDLNPYVFVYDFEIVEKPKDW